MRIRLKKIVSLLITLVILSGFASCGLLPGEDEIVLDTTPLYRQIIGELRTSLTLAEYYGRALPVSVTLDLSREEIDAIIESCLVTVEEIDELADSDDLILLLASISNAAADYYAYFGTSTDQHAAFYQILGASLIASIDGRSHLIHMTSDPMGYIELHEIPEDPYGEELPGDGLLDSDGDGENLISVPVSDDPPHLWAVKQIVGQIFAYPEFGTGDLGTDSVLFPAVVSGLLSAVDLAGAPSGQLFGLLDAVVFRGLDTFMVPYGPYPDQEVYTAVGLIMHDAAASLENLNLSEASGGMAIRVERLAEGFLRAVKESENMTEFPSEVAFHGISGIADTVRTIPGEGLADEATLNILIDSAMTDSGLELSEFDPGEAVANGLNAPPTAMITDVSADPHPETGQAVTLSAADSFDAEGEIRYFTWAIAPFTGFEGAYSAGFTDAAEYSAFSFTPTVNGVYTVTLTVYDGDPGDAVTRENTVTMELDVPASLPYDASLAVLTDNAINLYVNSLYYNGAPLLELDNTVPESADLRVEYGYDWDTDAPPRWLIDGEVLADATDTTIIDSTALSPGLHQGCVIVFTGGTSYSHGFTFRVIGEEAAE